MGCLKKIINTIIFWVVVFAFFACGGYAFLKNKYDEYTKPEREVLVKEEKDFGDLSKIPPDYALSRSLNFFGYRKLNAFYLPKNQKIAVFDLNSSSKLTKEDFEKGKIEEKIEALSSKIMNTPFMPIENIETIKTGKIYAGSRLVPYADFSAKVKYIPFVNVRGTIALYETENSDEGFLYKFKKEKLSSKLVVSTKLSNDYNEFAVKNFIEQLGL